MRVLSISIHQMQRAIMVSDMRMTATRGGMGGTEEQDGIEGGGK